MKNKVVFLIMCFFSEVYCSYAQCEVLDPYADGQMQYIYLETK